MQKVLRIGGIVAVIALIVAAIFASTTIKTPNSEKIWYEDMTLGNIDAKNYYVTYTDIVCPYCVAFENAVIEHEEDFERYLEENDILFEVRLSDFLYNYGQFPTKHSKYSAEAAYCARSEGKFWDYYRHAITTVWNDYFNKYGKTALTMLDNDKDVEYWLDLGKDVGLGDSFVSCVKNEDTLAEITERADKTADVVSGLPYFKFNSYAPPGFDLSWGWDYVLMFMNEGLKSAK